MLTKWYVLLREDSNTPIQIHWDKKHFDLQARSGKGYRVVTVMPINNGEFLHLPLLDENGNPIEDNY